LHIGIGVAVVLLYYRLLGHWFARVLTFLAFAMSLGFLGACYAHDPIAALFGMTVGGTAAWFLAAIPAYYWLRRFMEDHVFAVWDFMSLLKRLQQDMTCTRVPWLPADNSRAARLINDIVIGEETDVDPDGLYVSHLELYLRAMKDVGASTVQFETFCSMVRAGDPVEVVLTRISVAQHVHAFVTHTMNLANTGTTEEVLAAFFYGREDIIPEMFHRLLKTLYSAKHDERDLRHFIYYIDRHIELDGDSHGPKGKELLEELLSNSRDKAKRVMLAACSSIEARIALWNGILSKLHDGRDVRSAVQA
jgi:Protein of unknown function (DUF3050)